MLVLVCSPYFTPPLGFALGFRGSYPRPPFLSLPPSLLFFFSSSVLLSKQDLLGLKWKSVHTIRSGGVGERVRLRERRSTPPLQFPEGEEADDLYVDISPHVFGHRSN